MLTCKIGFQFQNLFSPRILTFSFEKRYFFFLQQYLFLLCFFFVHLFLFFSFFIFESNSPTVHRFQFCFLSSALFTLYGLLLLFSIAAHCFAVHILPRVMSTEFIVHIFRYFVFLFFSCFRCYLSHLSSRRIAFDQKHLATHNNKKKKKMK